MSDSSGHSNRTWRSGGADFQPHAFDPWAEPELFRGVLTQAGVRVPDRSHRAFDSGDPGGHVHRRIRRGYAWARMGAVLAGIAGHSDLGGDLLRRFAGRSAFGDAGHACDGSGTAHMVRRAGLFRARAPCMRCCSGFRYRSFTTCPAGRCCSTAAADCCTI